MVRSLAFSDANVIIFSEFSIGSLKNYFEIIPSVPYTAYPASPIYCGKLNGPLIVSLNLL